MLFYSHKNIDKLNKTVNQELKKIERWLCANKLSLNIKKTHLIIFKSKIKIKSVRFNQDK